MISNDQVQRKKLASTEQFVESKAIDVGISQITPEVKDMNQRVHAPPQVNVSQASVGSLFKETFAKFATSFKHQNSPSLFMVVTIAIILLLMQISILVLLSRPQRIHVIPQADCMSSVRGLTENRGEALASLNKQITYLKEEMHFVETMLEKLQNEHAQLKGKLKDLELFRNQRI
ncbi:UNVERIFIED_CONTAM: hypothetical protein Sradi_0539200 [Sesamum radiatum]|uniref:Uncharacterized protein n=1 Tax=Sesamum radiatum TaxID=300843 RepID=A0AAW2VI15_SESRA